MILEVIIDYLNSSDLDAPAYAEIPKRDCPEEFYIIELTGESVTDQLETATIVARSYGKNMKQAADLAYDLDNILRNGLVKLDYISGVKRNTVTNITDQSTKQYRYQGVYIITHY